MNIQEAIEHACEVAGGCYSESLCAYQHDKLADLIEELVRARADIERLATERDEAANCIYGIKTALENGDSRAAMEEIIRPMNGYDSTGLINKSPATRSGRAKSNVIEVIKC